MKQLNPKVMKIAMLASTFLVFLLGVWLLACEAKKPKPWQPLDLRPYGIPAAVLAPDSSKVENFELGGIQEVSITGPRGAESFSLQVYAGRAKSKQLVEQTGLQLLEVQSNPHFDKVVEKNREGFIYALKGSNPARYGFRYVAITRDTELVFTPGLNQHFELAEVKKLYEAVKQDE
jgi:hypothetical protein